MIWLLVCGKVRFKIALAYDVGAIVAGAYRQLRARRALSIIFKHIPLRTRRALSLYNVFDDSARLVLNVTSLNSDSRLLALDWRYVVSSVLPVSRHRATSHRWGGIPQSPAPPGGTPWAPRSTDQRDAPPGRNSAAGYSSGSNTSQGSMHIVISLCSSALTSSIVCSCY